MGVFCELYNFFRLGSLQATSQQLILKKKLVPIDAILS